MYQVKPKPSQFKKFLSQAHVSLSFLVRYKDRQQGDTFAEIELNVFNHINKIPRSQFILCIYRDLVACLRHHRVVRKKIIIQDFAAYRKSLSTTDVDGYWLCNVPWGLRCTSDTADRIFPMDNSVKCSGLRNWRKHNQELHTSNIMFDDSTWARISWFKPIESALLHMQLIFLLFTIKHVNTSIVIVWKFRL